MQRLIHSSRIPSKFRADPIPHSYFSDRPEPLRIGSFAPASGSVRVRFGLVRRCVRLSCVVDRDDEPSPSSARFSPVIGSYGDGTPPDSQPVEQRKEVGSISRKALLAGKIVLILALALIIIRPILPSPAFASFPTTATKARGSGLLHTEVLTSAWTGFFAGCLHTLSGPDHLAALAPLSIGRSLTESAAVGALWGFGHDAGQLIFGLVFLLLKDRLHIEVIKTWGNRVVGVTLLVIGAMGIKEASEARKPCIPLEDGDCDVSIFNSLESTNVGRKKIGFATFATGVVHGLQPDALMMVLPALALPSRVAGAAFLFMFLVGTVVAMGGYTVFIGSCSEALKERVPRITEKLTWASSLLAIGLGLAIIVSQYFGYTLY